MWQSMEIVKTVLMETFDANAPEFAGFLFASLSIFQGKLL